MSGDSARNSWARTTPDRESLGHFGATLTRVLFGGRPGLMLFCGSLALFMLTWRIGVYFNDIGLFPTMLEYMAEGKLSFGSPDEFEFGYPGMHSRNGEVYGRAYGLVAPAVPVLWVLEGTEALVNPTWLVLFGWSGLLLAIGALVGDHFGRQRQGFAVGGAVAGVALLGNAWFYKPLVSDLKVVALQVVTMIAGAVVVVTIYRLLADRHGTKLGLLGGAAVLLGTPVAFWATTPKRHTLTAMFVVLALFLFARSRSENRTVSEQTAYRGGAYAAAGLLAWVHAPEGFTLLAAIALVDVPTAPRNDVRSLAIVGAMFGVSLLPYLVTNALVSGNPLLPPHFLDSYHGEALAESANSVAGSGGTASTGSSASGTTGTDSGGALAVVLGAIGTVAHLFSSGIEKVTPLIQHGVTMYVSGFVELFTEPDQVFQVFVRWGTKETSGPTLFFDGGTNLSVLESMPLIAALIALPVRRRVEELRTGTRRLRDIVDPVDLVVIVFAVLFTSLYMNRLPVHIMTTVRYLHPLYPLAVYGLFRLPQVRSLIESYTRQAILGYEATVLLGTPLTFGAMLLFETTKGQMVQNIGLASLAIAGILALSLLIARRDDRATPVAAGAFGMAVGVATIYLLVTSFVLFHYGPSALPAVDRLTGEFRWLSITMPSG